MDKNSPKSVTSTRNNSYSNNISSICGGILDQTEINERLRAFEQKSRRQIVQENGQRKYLPPPDWNGPEPPRGCEVFIGKLPRRMYEDEIIPIFENVGPLYQFRLMMDFAGTNRGFAFAKYTNKADAKKAIAQLDNYEIRKNQHIGVVMSVENCRLYLGHIPRNKTCDEVHEEICKLTEGVVKIILYPNADDRSKNRGFAFVEYVSHKAATVARRKLIPGQVTMWNVPVEVDWAEPEQEPDEDVIAQVKNLYVRNLMDFTTEADLKSFFEKITGPDTVEHVKKLKDFAFVHFKNKNDATLALQNSNGEILDGSKIEVVWAKPADQNLKRLKNLQMATSGNGTGSHPQNAAAGNFVSAAHAAALLAAPISPSTAAFSSATAGFGAYLPGPAPGQIIFAAQPTTTTHTASVVPRLLYNGMSAFNFPNPCEQVQVGVGPVNASLASLAGSPSAMPYAGMPFIDPTAGTLSHANNQRSSNINRNRSAAGMRSAGYQNAISNGCVNRMRKKFTENLNVSDSSIILPANGLGQNGLFFLSHHQPLPTFATAARLTATNGAGSTFPVVSQMVSMPSTLFPKPYQQQQDIIGATTTITNENLSPSTLLSGGQQQHQNLSPSSSSLSSVPVVHQGYCQLLDDYCRQNHCDRPEYQATSLSTKDVRGNDVLLYVCKVTIANFVPKYGAFETLQPSATIDEAKEKAAFAALVGLGYSFNERNDQGSNHFIYPQVVQSAGLIPFVVHTSDIPAAFYTTSSENGLAVQPQIETPTFCEIGAISKNAAVSCLQQVSASDNQQQEANNTAQQHIIQQAA